MDKVMPDPNARIAGWMKESQATEWLILDPEGVELCRYSSAEEAQRALGRLKTLLKDEAASRVRIETADRWPQYLDARSVICDYARYCEWALRQLGYLTIFAFSHEESDALFMLLDRDGQKITRPTLASALYAMLLRREKSAKAPNAMSGYL